MNPPCVCVTGASGGLGQALLTELVDRFTVRALFRRENEVSKQWANRGCQIVLGDLHNRRALQELVAGTDVVFHCAAKVIGFSAREFFDVNVEGTRSLAEVAAACQCRRFVHVSSVAVYSGTDVPDGGAFTEALPLAQHAAMDPYSLSKLQAEQVVIETLSKTVTGYTILRPTCIYGPRVQSWTLLPIKLISRRRTLFLGLDGGEGLMDAVYVEDVIRALVTAAEAPGASGEIFNIGHETVTFREFYSHLGQMAGHQPRLGSERRLRQFARVVHAGSRVVKRGLPEIERGILCILKMSLNRHPYPSSKANAVLGYAPRFTLPVGMLNTELWLKERHLLPRLNHQIPNADRHYVVRPSAVAHPRTETDLIAIVRESGRRKLKLKAIGALHSFAPIPDTEGVGVVLDRYNRLLSVGKSSVTVEAGITLAELNRELARQELALPIHGSHTAQTLAGAISTATHGGSLHHGTLSDHVEEIRIVKPGGEAITIGAGDPRFQGAVVSLGLLGIISTVTLRCVPRFFLRSEASVKPFEEVLEGFDAIQRDNEYVDLRYYPRIGQVEMLAINRTGRPDKPITVSASPPTSRLQRRLVSCILKTLLTGLAATRNESVHKAVLNRLIGKSYTPRTGGSEYVLTFTDLDAGEPFPIDDLEFAIPYSQATAALRSLTDHFRRTRDYPPFFPVHIRCSKAGAQWLGPNYEREVCWLEFWHYPPRPRFYANLHEILQPYGYRPHWGKLCAADPAYVRRQFPCWEDFARLRREWDPSGILLNPYLAKWFGAG